ncbi:MAG: right-handed parallel beta-helix repeat-containing protein [Isosphaeraceae bacterium]|nr:right-handed parallel beta-helix repeat-containing protein [Isosphaeraceae bacterium]
MNPLLLALALACSSPADTGADVVELLEVASDTRLDPAKTYRKIVIKASGVALDGAGARVVAAETLPPAKRRGVGVEARGVSDIAIKDLRVHGFETGLVLDHVERATVSDSDFSDNFHDPDFGWGENGRRGGIVVKDSRGVVLRANKSLRNWDACSLIDSDDCKLVDNDFSHASNVCLRLLHASRNLVEDNRLTHGIRISPGEVHARDSTGVLLENGSDDNRFFRNDVRHGGDGIFIRVLNGWVSKRNLFVENDVSHANNNGFEAWSPENTYIRNKADHCSYGFWLGASDKTVLEGNRACFNGKPDGPHNSPHLPDKGHAGIIFLFGPSSHTVVRNNHCEGNEGAGIALVGAPPKYLARHWLIEGNSLIDNRWGIYARHADWITLGTNRFQGNRVDFDRDATVANVFEASSAAALPAERRIVPRIEGPKVVSQGVETVFRAAGTFPESSRVRMSSDDGVIVEAREIRRRFDEPGLRRLGITVESEGSNALAWLDVRVVDAEPELEIPAENWSGVDPRSRFELTTDLADPLEGTGSIRAEVSPYGGGRVALVARLPRPIPLDELGRIRFQIRAQNPNIPGWQGPNPVVRILGGDRSLMLTPKVDRLAQPDATEDRDSWTRFDFPLAGGPGVGRSGELPSRAESLEIGLDSWGAEPFTVWIDGIRIE